MDTPASPPKTMQEYVATLHSHHLQLQTDAIHHLWETDPSSSSSPAVPSHPTTDHPHKSPPSSPTKRHLVEPSPIKKAYRSFGVYEPHPISLPSLQPTQPPTSSSSSSSQPTPTITRPRGASTSLHPPPLTSSRRSPSSSTTSSSGGSSLETEDEAGSPGLEDLLGLYDHSAFGTPKDGLGGFGLAEGRGEEEGVVDIPTPTIPPPPQRATSDLVNPYPYPYTSPAQAYQPIQTPSVLTNPYSYSFTPSHPSSYSSDERSELTPPAPPFHTNPNPSSSSPSSAGSPDSFSGLAQSPAAQPGGRQQPEGKESNRLSAEFGRYLAISTSVPVAAGRKRSPLSAKPQEGDGAGEGEGVKGVRDAKGFQEDEDEDELPPHRGLKEEDRASSYTRSQSIYTPHPAAGGTTVV